MEGDTALGYAAVAEPRAKRQCHHWGDSNCALPDVLPTSNLATLENDNYATASASSERIHRSSLQPYEPSGEASGYLFDDTERSEYPLWNDTHSPQWIEVERRLTKDWSDIKNNITDYQIASALARHIGSAKCAVETLVREYYNQKEDDGDLPVGCENCKRVFSCSVLEMEHECRGYVQSDGEYLSDDSFVYDEDSSVATEEDVSTATVVDACHGTLHIAYQPYVFMHNHLTMFNYTLLIFSLCQENVEVYLDKAPPRRSSPRLAKSNDILGGESSMSMLETHTDLALDMDNVDGIIDTRDQVSGDNSWEENTKSKKGEKNGTKKRKKGKSK